MERLATEVESAFLTEMNDVYGDKAAVEPAFAEVLASQRDFQETFRSGWPRP